MATSPSKNQVCISKADKVLEIDLEALFSELSQYDNDGLFLSEICDQLQCSVPKARKFVRQAVDAGRCTPVRKQKEYIDGRISTAPAYVFHGAEEAA